MDGNSDVEQNKIYAILAYIGILFIVPLLVAKESPFAKYHTNQGVVLFIIGIATSIGLSFFNTFIDFFVFNFIFGITSCIVSLGWLALAIMGIMNAAQGEMKPLPVIGGIQIIK